MAKTKKPATTFDPEAQVTELRLRIADLEASLAEVQGKVTKDIGAVHRSLKDYKKSNDQLVAELRKRIEGVAQTVPRRRG